MESFIKINETDQFVINGTECNNEFENYSNAVDINDLDKTKDFFGEFLNCFKNLYLSLTKLVEPFTPSIRGSSYLF